MSRLETDGEAKHEVWGNIPTNVITLESAAIEKDKLMLLLEEDPYGRK